MPRSTSWSGLECRMSAERWSAFFCARANEPYIDSENAFATGGRHLASLYPVSVILEERSLTCHRCLRPHIGQRPSSAHSDSVSQQMLFAPATDRALGLEVPAIGLQQGFYIISDYTSYSRPFFRGLRQFWAESLLWAWPWFCVPSQIFKRERLRGYLAGIPCLRPLTTSR